MTNKIGYEIPYCYSRLYIGTYAVSVIYEGAWIADFVSAFVVVKRVLKTLRNVKSFLIVIVSLYPYWIFKEKVFRQNWTSQTLIPIRVIRGYEICVFRC